MFNCFPTEWQRIVFRNYGLVPVENIAKTLKIDVETVKNSAVALGLGKVEFNPDWLKKGFVTVIRNNWDVLRDEQIIELVGMEMAEYRKLLVEYDFLDVKLGKKPELSTVEFCELNEIQQKQTEEIKEFVEKKFFAEQIKPFDFFHEKNNIVTLPLDDCMIEDRFTSHYCADYGSVLTDDELADYSEDYLIRLSSTGVNGLWLHESLKNLAEFPFDPVQSEGYEKRVANLRKLTERCKKFGVNVYVYLNEPRSQSVEFFEKYPELKGQECDGGGYCLCTSKPQVKEYLYNAVKSLAENVPLLKAIMTITMSENPTHCYARPFGDNPKSTTTCPDCAKRKPEEVAAEVNNIIARALKDGNGYTKLIANLWGWADFMNWTEDMIMHGVELLDKDIEILCVSEFSKKFKRGGVQSQVIDYSISVIGPSDITVKTLAYAKSKGHKIWAKIQANTSWECAGVPYVPAFGRMVKHVQNLKKLGISGLMLGWSLGGFPGGALSLCASACSNKKIDQKLWYEKTYGKNGKIAMKAVKGFDKAFGEFPFSINALYFGGQNMGSGNLYDLDPDKKESTMVCYTYDDYEFWTDPYGIDVYINQLKKLTTRWGKALEIIKNIDGNVDFEELKRCAEGVYLLMKATLNLAEFAKFKRASKENAQKLLEILDRESVDTEEMYKLMAKDAKIGYEVTNHYFTNRQRLLEKLINLKVLKEKIKE